MAKFLILLKVYLLYKVKKMGGENDDRYLEIITDNKTE
jgi:hypothetical protein